MEILLGPREAGGLSVEKAHKYRLSDSPDTPSVEEIRIYSSFTVRNAQLLTKQPSQLAENGGSQAELQRVTGPGSQSQQVRHPQTAQSQKADPVPVQRELQWQPRQPPPQYGPIRQNPHHPKETRFFLPSLPAVTRQIPRQLAALTTTHTRRPRPHLSTLHPYLPFVNPIRLEPRVTSLPLSLLPSRPSDLRKPYHHSKCPSSVSPPEAPPPRPSSAQPPSGPPPASSPAPASAPRHA